jgi:hypothetical protein
MTLPDSSMIKVKQNKPRRGGRPQKKDRNDIMCKKLVAPCGKDLFDAATARAKTLCNGNRAEYVRRLVKQDCAQNQAPVAE